MSWAEHCPESFPQLLRNLSLHSCFLCHFPKCLPAAALLWPSSSLVRVLLIIWVHGLHTFALFLLALFILFAPPHSLLLASLCFLPFPACTSVMLETLKIKDVSEPWLKVQNGLSGSKMLCALASSGWLGTLCPLSGHLYAVATLTKAGGVPPISPLPFPSSHVQPTSTAAPGPCA